MKKRDVSSLFRVVSSSYWAPCCQTEEATGRTLQTWGDHRGSWDNGGCLQVCMPLSITGGTVLQRAFCWRDCELVQIFTRGINTSKDAGLYVTLLCYYLAMVANKCFCFLCMCCFRSHKRQVHSVQDEPRQQRGFFGVRGEEVVDPSADCGERRERRRPHRHLEKTLRLIPDVFPFLQMSREARRSTRSRFISSPLISEKKSFSKLFLCRFWTVQKVQKAWQPAFFDMQWRFHTPGIGTTFPLWFFAHSNCWVFLCRYILVLKQTVTRTCCIHQTNQRAAAVCVFYCPLFQISRVDAATIISVVPPRLRFVLFSFSPHFSSSHQY